jgi:ATP-binding cassette subfamily B protein
VTRFLARSVIQFGQWRGLAIALACALLLQMLYQIGTPLMFKAIFDDAIAAHRADVLVYAIATLVGLLVAFGIGGVLQEVVMARLATRCVNLQRQAIFDRIQAHAPDFFQKTSGGEIGARFGSDLAAYEMALLRAVPHFVLQGTVILVACGFLLLINWQLALIAFAAMTAIFLAPRPFVNRAEGASRSLDGANTALADMVLESVLAQLVVRVFNLQPLRRTVFENRLSSMLVPGTRTFFHTGMIARAAYVASGLTQVLIIGVGAYLAFQGFMTGGQLIAFVGLLLGIGDAVSTITSSVPVLIAGANAIQRVNAFLAQEPRRIESADARPLPAFDRSIRFDDVSFSYDGTNRVLDGVSLEIRKGQSVAFVGPSGCGKSTMLALLLRLHAPTRGRIFFDDRPLESITEPSLRTLLSMVPQMPVLLDGTIRDNLRLGKADAADDELVRAMRTAAIDAFVSALPNGLETPVGSGGGQLSGGQRQRIAIARALLRDAPVLVLDEATSALDPDAEFEINRAMLEEAGRRTIVSVTHRLSSVVKADSIFVFDSGRLVESGNHDTLLLQNGLYRRLWDKQQGFEIHTGDAVASVSAERLRSIPFFTAVDQATLERFADAFVVERFREDNCVFRQGDAGDKFYILIRGSIEIRLAGQDGKDRVLTVLTDGDFFGEIALVEDRPRTATVRARTDCWCLALPRKSFLTELRKSPVLAGMVREAIRVRLNEQTGTS